MRIKNMSTQLIFFITGITFMLVLYFSYFHLISTQKKALYKNLEDKAFNTAALSKSLITKAIEIQDDLLLLAQIESIMKLSDVKNAYLIDATGKVIVHNKTNEWGKIYDDKKTRKALSKTSYLFQKEEQELFFSYPIRDTLMLCIELDTLGIEKILTSTKLNSFYFLIIFFVIIMTSTILFVQKLISSKFRAFKHVLESVILGNGGKIELKTHNEFQELSLLLNTIIEMVETTREKTQEELQTIKNGFCHIIQMIQMRYAKNIIAVLDNEHKFIFGADTIKEQLKLVNDIPPNTHILEINELGFLFPSIKESLRNPSSIIAYQTNDTNLEILSLNEQGKPVCTIIAKQEKDNRQ